MPKPVTFYDTTEQQGLEKLSKDLDAAYQEAARLNLASSAQDDEGETDEEGLEIGIPDEDVEIPEFDELIGIDPSVRRQIEAALKAGKRHLMLYGPPGTGKTEIARKVADLLAKKSKLITGSADWSSQDIIGGYQPLGDGKIGFVPGVLLQHFDRPLIIDELNRCDIDKVIGPLFTVLSGQPSTLPYRKEVGDLESEQYVVLPRAKPGAQSHEFSPGNSWRIIATINSIDKASLYQMSYALARRFGWVYVDAPRDLDGFILEYAKRKKLNTASPTSSQKTPLGDLWRAINSVRVVGPAPIIDLINSVALQTPEIDFSAPPTENQKTSYLDGFDLFLMPMLDGILAHEAESVADAATNALGLEAGQSKALARRLSDLAI